MPDIRVMRSKSNLRSVWDMRTNEDHLSDAQAAAHKARLQSTHCRCILVLDHTLSHLAYREEWLDRVGRSAGPPLRSAYGSSEQPTFSACSSPLHSLDPHHSTLALALFCCASSTCSSQAPPYPQLRTRRHLRVSQPPRTSGAGQHELTRAVNTLPFNSLASLTSIERPRSQI